MSLVQALYTNHTTSKLKQIMWGGNQQVSARMEIPHLSGSQKLSPAFKVTRQTFVSYKTAPNDTMCHDPVVLAL